MEPKKECFNETSDHEDTCSEEESMSESETPTTSDEEFIVSDEEEEDSVEELIEENENLKKENKVLKNELKKQGEIIWEISRGFQIYKRELWGPRRIKQNLCKKVKRMEKKFAYAKSFKIFCMRKKFLHKLNFWSQFFCFPREQLLYFYQGCVIYDVMHMHTYFCFDRCDQYSFPRNELGKRTIDEAETTLQYVFITLSIRSTEPKNSIYRDNPSISPMPVSSCHRGE